MTSTADDVPDSDYAFGSLPYQFDDLEPYIDHKTMRLHYGKHHKGYYKKFLNAIKNSDAQGKSIIEILKNVSQYSNGVRNNGGGYYNHWLFWHSLTPETGQQPGEELSSAIEKAFGSFEEFKETFSNAAASQFGSGWAWLIVDDEGNLLVTSTSNQDNPIMDVVETNGMPILALDVWEHAYYLKYNNKRTKYIENFWKLVDWENVDQRYKEAVNQEEIFTP
ncbi:MAG: superoxide dismutase [Bacteroidota bacterium]